MLMIGQNYLKYYDIIFFRKEMETMDYVVNGKNVFVTSKNLHASKSPSPDAQARRDYIRSHEFSVTMGTNNKPNVTVTKK